MNRRLTLTLFSILIVAGAVFLWQSRDADKATHAAAEEAPAPGPATTALGVDQFMRAVDDYRGPVTVDGAVSAVVADEQTLALIDVRELAQCGVVTCATLTLPVHWAGPMPSVRDIVRLQGEAKESSGKLVFFASSLEKVDLKTEGGSQ